MSDQQSEEKKFKVTDRRHFTESGEVRPESESTPAEQPGSAAPPTVEGGTSARAEGRAPAKIDFSSFVLSLAGSAMMHMGEGPPGAPESKNLEAAKQMIDILEMLQEKTEGNRSADESQLLKQILFELQMTFVRKKS